MVSSAPIILSTSSSDEKVARLLFAWLTSEGKLKRLLNTTPAQKVIALTLKTEEAKRENERKKKYQYSSRKLHLHKSTGVAYFRLNKANNSRVICDSLCHVSILKQE
jgi:hypothetical protein